MRPTKMKLTGLIVGSALLLGCNVNLAGALAGANIQGNADIKVDNRGPGGGPGDPGGPGGTGGTVDPGGSGGPGVDPGSGYDGTSGLRDVTSIRIETNTDTLFVGALPPWEGERYPDHEMPYNNGGPTLFPSPRPVGDPYPIPGVAAKFELWATVRGSNRVIRVPPEDPGFQLSFEPNVPMDLNRQEGWLYPRSDTPPGQVTFKVTWKHVVARRTLEVVTAGQASVVAE